MNSVWIWIASSLFIIFFVAFVYQGFEIATLRRESNTLRAILTSEATETIDLWTAAAAKEADYGQVCLHFKKHVEELFKEVKHTSDSDKASWSASTHNLLDIYDQMNNISPSPQLRLARMMLKYHSEPGQTPPPPARKIEPYRDRSYDNGS